MPENREGSPRKISKKWALLRIGAVVTAVATAAGIGARFHEEIGRTSEQIVENLHGEDSLMGKAVDSDGKIVDPESEEAIVIMVTDTFEDDRGREREMALRKEPDPGKELGKIIPGVTVECRRLLGKDYPNAGVLTVFPVDESGKKSEKPYGLWYEPLKPILIKDDKGQQKEANGFVSGNGLRPPSEQELAAFLQNQSEIPPGE